MVDSIAVSLLAILAAAPPNVAVRQVHGELTPAACKPGMQLRAANTFRGRGIVVVEGGRGVVIEGLVIDGNRAALATPAGLPPYDVPFAKFTAANGIWADNVDQLTIRNVRFRNIAGFAILVSRCRNVRIENVTVEDSGSRNAKGRNNTTGGILIEEGTTDFQVSNSTFIRVIGNGVWTHSNYTSPRNARGRFTGNRFDTIARDALQVGHATEVSVDHNTGVRIGWPIDAVDTEGGGTPVAIDTAGNVDRSSYADNRFEEINGKCVDLDGFHNGEVSRNTCINRGAASAYPFGHFAIVFNNTNPDMRSEKVRVVGNTIDGAKFGGIFVVGEQHEIRGNVMRRLNLAGCSESAPQVTCEYFAGEPDLLRTGIYLGQRAERRAPAAAVVIEDNEISGHRMKTRCIGFAPGVTREANRIGSNRCLDTGAAPRSKK